MSSLPSPLRSVSERALIALSTGAAAGPVARRAGRGSTWSGRRHGRRGGPTHLLHEQVGSHSTGCPAVPPGDGRVRRADPAPGPQIPLAIPTGSSGSLTEVSPPSSAAARCPSARRRRGDAPAQHSLRSTRAECASAASRIASNSSLPTGRGVVAIVTEAAHCGQPISNHRSRIAADIVRIGDAK